jgi:hypothetical protein
MKLLAETFQRRIVVNDLKKWLMENIKAFFWSVFRIVSVSNNMKY